MAASKKPHANANKEKQKKSKCLFASKIPRFFRLVVPNNTSRKKIKFAKFLKWKKIWKKFFLRVCTVPLRGVFAVLSGALKVKLN